MSLTITYADGTPIAGAISMTIERGIDSEKTSIRIMNTGSGDVTGAFVAMYAEIGDPGSGDFRTSGRPVLDEIMGRFQITGQDSTATPGQEVILDVVQPLGHLQAAQLPTIKSGDWIIADVWLRQPGQSAGESSANVMFRVANDSPARPVTEGLTAAARGVLSGVNEPRSFFISGRDATASGTPDDEVHFAAGSWLLLGAEYTDATTQDVTLDQNDGASAALGSGESYWAAITQGTSSTPTTTRGLKGTSPTKPTPPSGELILAFVQVTYDAGGGAIATGDIFQDLTYGRLLGVAPVSGLTLTVHAGEALIADFHQVHSVKEDLALVASETNRIWMEATGYLSVTQSADQPSAGALLLYTAVTDGSSVTTLTDGRVFVGAAGALSPHAANHATGGSDPVSPASIGAASTADLALKADLASPALTGTPTAPTALAGDDSTQIATTAFVQTATGGELGANGEVMQRGHISEEITLDTGNAFTDSAANLIPANAVIEGVVWRVTQAITTAANFKLGDSGTADRFQALTTSISLGDTGVAFNHRGTTAEVQATAAKLRVTLNTTPAAGKIRVTVFYLQFTAPTS